MSIGSAVQNSLDLKLRRALGTNTVHQTFRDRYLTRIKTRVFYYAFLSGSYLCVLILLIGFVYRMACEFSSSIRYGVLVSFLLNNLAARISAPSYGIRCSYRSALRTWTCYSSIFLHDRFSATDEDVNFPPECKYLLVITRHLQQITSCGSLYF